MPNKESNKRGRDLITPESIIQSVDSADSLSTFAKLLRPLMSRSPTYRMLQSAIKKNITNQSVNESVDNQAVQNSITLRASSYATIVQAVRKCDSQRILALQLKTSTSSVSKFMKQRETSFCAVKLLIDAGASDTSIAGFFERQSPRGEGSYRRRIAALSLPVIVSAVAQDHAVHQVMAEQTSEPLTVGDELSSPYLLWTTPIENDWDLPVELNGNQTTIETDVDNSELDKLIFEAFQS